jgi:hypothetical protein
MLRTLTLSLLLACAGCASDSTTTTQALTNAAVPRDARGEPAFPGIAPAPDAPPVSTETCAHRRRCP